MPGTNKQGPDGAKKETGRREKSQRTDQSPKGESKKRGTDQGLEQRFASKELMNLKQQYQLNRLKKWGYFALPNYRGVPIRNIHPVVQTLIRRTLQK